MRSSNRTTQLLTALGVAVGLMTAAQALSAQAHTGPLTPEPIRLASVAVDGVDLGIADDHMYRRPIVWSTHPPDKPEGNEKVGYFREGEEARPGIFIAWRNTELVEEVEVRVRNLGNQEGRGEVSIDIINDGGQVELHLEPLEYNRVITIPPRDKGGLEGRVVKMTADRRLNRLIDLYDRIRKPYSVRATVRTVGAVDANLTDNVKFKSFNIPFAAMPGYRQTYNYRFTNDSAGTRQVRWKLESTQLPTGWQVSGTSLPKEPFAFTSGTPLIGSVSIDVPTSTREGEMAELRLSLVDATTGEILNQREWFLARDVTPPTISEVRIRTQQPIQLRMEPGMVRIDLMASDLGSGVFEASGVWVDFSSDGGRTFMGITAAYETGNFITPTSFTANIGPFRPRTKLIVFVGAMDCAGNVARYGPEEVVTE
jgi:hypothetical protein